MRLDFLRPLYAGTSDYASLYLDASRTTEDAAELVALRWRAARERLAEHGADQAMLGALEELVTTQDHSVPGLAAFARHGEVAFTAALRAGQASEVLIADDPSSTDRAWVGPQPADVAVSRHELTERGVGQTVEDRADAAVVRAAAATGAELRSCPKGRNRRGAASARCCATRRHRTEPGAGEQRIGRGEDPGYRGNDPFLSPRDQERFVARDSGSHLQGAGGQLVAGWAEASAPLRRRRGRRARGRAVPSVRQSRSRVRAASSRRETCICEMPSRPPISACVMLP